MTASPLSLARAAPWLGPAVLTVAIAGIVFAALMLLASAPDQGDRRAALKRDQARLAALPKAAEGESDYGRGAVCLTGLAPAVVLLRARLENAAAASGLVLTDLSLVEGPASASDQLSTIQISVSASGAYAQGLNFSKILSDGAPVIFVDKLEVFRGGGETTEWRLNGHLYCAIRLPA